MADDANALPGVTAAQKSAMEEHERTLGAQESVSEVVSEVFSGYVCHSIEVRRRRTFTSLPRHVDARARPSRIFCYVEKD